MNLHIQLTESQYFQALHALADVWEYPTHNNKLNNVLSDIQAQPF